MNFLAPWALLLSVAAAVPLLLHLLRRRSGERVDFPALRYLLRAEREHAREVRLRNLLLLLVRIALVLAIAVALARPIGPLPGVGHPPSAVAIVVDNSASSAAVVGGSTLLELHRRAARAVLAAARDADELTLVTIDGALRAGSREALLAAVDSLQRIDGAGDATAALRRADAALAASALPERRLVIFADGQPSTWGDVRGDSLAAVRLLFLPDGQRPANRALLAVAVEPPYWSPRGTLRTEWQGDSAAWRVALAGATVARGRANNAAPIVTSVQPALRGWVGGSIEIDADEYRSDDVRHFAVYVGDAPALYADAGSPFLREAAATLIASGRARAGSAVGLLPAQRARTSALLFAPSDPLQVAAANRALALAGVPWRFGARRSGPAPLRGDGLDGATVQQWYALESIAAQDVDTLASVAGQPWAVAGDGYVLVASAPDAEATDLPLRAAFVPWIERVVGERLGQANGRVDARAAGQGVRVPRGAESLEAPDGSLQRLDGRTQIDAPATAGSYFWRRGAERIGALVVNPEAAESALAPMDADSLQAALGAERRLDAGDALARATFAAGGRRALDTPLLILALALLLAESWLARRGRTTRTAD